MNGVTHSLRQVMRHLENQGHEARVFAPRAGREELEIPGSHGGVSLLRSVPLPSYPEVRLTFARAKRLEAMLREFAPDVVHLASPFVLGWQALRAADHLGIPTVAIYQTDIPGYAQRYGIPAATAALAQHVARIHKRATLTLAPSSSAMAELAALGVDRLRLWARGVDAERFHPRHRDERLRRELAPNGEVIVGYVGRLAPEKQVEDLRVLADLPGVKLVIVGDGPSRAALEKQLPEAAFLGFQGGTELGRSVASFDVFVHPGENETFCQTIQEALASGVPVVATGRGGPLDLVRSSRTGWLYRPGDLAELRSRVHDLAGDAGKRRAFAIAARESVADRSWARLGDELLGHYRDAITGRTDGIPAGARTVDRMPAPPAPQTPVESRTRYVALGDSITEGLCDDSRQSEGEYRGWADRLAMLLAHAESRTEPLLYANLAVRSRLVADVVDEQLPRAIELKADLVSVLVGGNDLAHRGCDPARLAARLGEGIAAARASGAEVLLVTPFIPPWGPLKVLHDRTAVFARELRAVAAQTGCRLLDFSELPERLDERAWAPDRVHLSSHGHRMLSYHAAAALRLPGAVELGDLDRAVHAEPLDGIESLTTPAWMWTHVRPWLGRRLRGRTAGDGMSARRGELLPVLPADPSERRSLSDV